MWSVEATVFSLLQTRAQSFVADNTCLFVCQKRAHAGAVSSASIREKKMLLVSNIQKNRLKKAQVQAKLAMIQAQEAKHDAEMLRLNSLEAVSSQGL